MCYFKGTVCGKIVLYRQIVVQQSKEPPTYNRTTIMTHQRSWLRFTLLLLGLFPCILMEVSVADMDIAIAPGRPESCPNVGSDGDYIKMRTGYEYRGDIKELTTICQTIFINGDASFLSKQSVLFLGGFLRVNGSLDLNGSTLKFAQFIFNTSLFGRADVDSLKIGVSGCLDAGNDSTIEITLSRGEIEQLTTLPESARNVQLLRSNGCPVSQGESPALILDIPDNPNPCSQVAVSPSGEGTSLLLGIFAFVSSPDPTCSPNSIKGGQNPNTKWIILGSAMGVVLVIVILVLVFAFNSKARNLARPFASRNKSSTKNDVPSKRLE